MKKLIKELYKRRWEYTMSVNPITGEYHLTMILGNELKVVDNDIDAKQLLKEIKKYW